jgi:hypothetical protein
MTCISKCRLGVVTVEMIALLLLGQVASAENSKDKPYRHSGVELPISLAIGTVRSPEFVAKHDLYQMKIEAEWLLPTVELRCKMGFGVVPPTDKCRAQAVLEVEWRVLDGGNVVARGSAGGISGEFEASKDYLDRYIGQFQGQSKHKYVVELTFIKDGSSLNVTNPRLIVSPPDFAF